MNKQGILTQAWHSDENATHEDAAYQAMDTYARQEAIGFHRFCEDLPIDIHNQHTAEELYLSYQQQKQK